MPPDTADRLSRSAAEAPCLVLTLDSSSLSVRAGLLQLRTALSDLALDPEAAGTIEIVLAEVLNNIGEHAYRSLDEGRIKLSIWVQDEMLIFETQDSGLPMPNGRMPAGRAAALDGPVEEIPEGGFGWHLIRRLTADLNYARIEGSNRLTFRMRRDARPLRG